ncbi:MAG: IclR family transcriptional regulator [Paracoccaceae bacterium]
MATPLNSSVLKALDILDLVTPERHEVTAAVVASELGMNTATAHRFLLTLEAAGVLVSGQRGRFTLGPRLERLGRMAEAVNPMAARVQAVIEGISQQVNESVMACRLGREGPTCMAVATADRPISVNIKVGTVLPMLPTAQGRLWLAMMGQVERRAWFRAHPGQAPDAAGMDRLEQDLARIRAAGFAVNDGDNEPDIGAVAVPVVGGDGRVQMTLSAFGMLSRFDDALIARAKALLKDAAERLGAGG